MVVSLNKKLHWYFWSLGCHLVTSLAPKWLVVSQNFFKNIQVKLGMAVPNLLF